MNCSVLCGEIQYVSQRLDGPPHAAHGIADQTAVVGVSVAVGMVPVIEIADVVRLTRETRVLAASRWKSTFGSRGKRVM